MKVSTTSECTALEERRREGNNGLKFLALGGTISKPPCASRTGPWRAAPGTPALGVSERSLSGGALYQVLLG